MQQDSGVPSIAKLNVGGHYFTTSLQTNKGSKLNAGRHVLREI